MSASSENLGLQKSLPPFPTILSPALTSLWMPEALPASYFLDLLVSDILFSAPQYHQRLYQYIHFQAASQMSQGEREIQELRV